VVAGLGFIIGKTEAAKRKGIVALLDVQTRRIAEVMSSGRILKIIAGT
jgi:hypothetical protein